MSLIPFKDFWTEFAEKISTVCPKVPATQLKPIFEELEASIERRITQAVDEAAAKAAEQTRQSKRLKSISSKRSLCQVFYGSRTAFLEEAKRLKSFWEKSEEILGGDVDDIKLKPPKKQWEDAEHDPEIGETLVDDKLREYQYELVYNNQRFRPDDCAFSTILQAYKRAVPQELWSRKQFFQLYKTSPESDEVVLELVKILRKQVALEKLLNLATEVSTPIMEGINEALKFPD